MRQPIHEETASYGHVGRTPELVSKTFNEGKADENAFGDPDCFRMSYATSDENIVEAIRRIKEALSKLK